MRTPRSALLLLSLAAVAGCARCGAPKSATPPERFVAADAAAVLVVPSVEAFARQASEALATAATFPGGKDLLDARAVLGARLGVDPFDPASLTGAGLDTAGGISLSAAVGKRGPQNPDVVLTLPVADAAAFEARVTRVVKDRFPELERVVEAGSPEVIGWRQAAGAPLVFGYALVERTAIVSFGPEVLDAIRAAAAVPAGATVAGNAEYQKTAKALGDAQAMRFFVPAGSPALQELPQLKDGLAFGLHGGRDRLGFAAAVLVGAREAALREAVTRAESKPLLAMLDPGAALVARSDGDPSASMDVEAITGALAAPGFPPELRALVTDFIEALGSGSALGAGLIPAPEGEARVTDDPLRFVRLELVASLKDPAKMTATIQGALRFMQEAGSPPPPAGRKAKPPPPVPAGPWRFPLPGGELGLTVADGRLAVAVGPSGSLDALLGRSGTAFKGPTAAADEALRSPTGGMYVDVPRLAAAVKTVPEAAWGAGEQGVMIKSMADQWASAAERITAISARGDLADGVAVGRLLVEVKAPPAK